MWEKDNLRSVSENEHPVRNFVIESETGQCYETHNPLWLMEIAIEQGYAAMLDDCALQEKVNVKQLQRESIHLSALHIYAPVYDANGLVFDPKTLTNDFFNLDSPLYLDAYDAFTVLQSLVYSGRVKIYEKIPYLTAKTPHNSCEGCAFFLQENRFCSVWCQSLEDINDKGKNCPYSAHGRYDDYLDVTVANMTNPSFKVKWKPFDQRLKFLDVNRQHLMASKL